MTNRMRSIHMKHYSSSFAGVKCHYIFQGDFNCVTKGLQGLPTVPLEVLCAVCSPLRGAMCSSQNPVEGLCAALKVLLEVCAQPLQPHGRAVHTLCSPLRGFHGVLTASLEELHTAPAIPLEVLCTAPLEELNADLTIRLVELHTAQYPP